MTNSLHRDIDRSPSEPIDRLSIACGLVAIVIGSAIVVGVLDRAWLDCAGDIEAGGRFAVRFELFFLFTPLVLLATATSVFAPTIALREQSLRLRVVVAVTFLVATMMIALAWAVPHPFGSYRVESADGPNPACRADSVPMWWPTWLPS